MADELSGKRASSLVDKTGKEVELKWKEIVSEQETCKWGRKKGRGGRPHHWR
jgi:hypothetical protein